MRSYPLAPPRHGSRRGKSGLVAAMTVSLAQNQKDDTGGELGGWVIRHASCCISI